MRKVPSIAGPTSKNDAGPHLQTDKPFDALPPQGIEPKPLITKDVLSTRSSEKPLEKGFSWFLPYSPRHGVISTPPLPGLSPPRR